MKKNYFLVALLSFVMVTMNAQFTDDCESYPGNNTPVLNEIWGSWDGSEGTAILSSGAQFNDGSLSVLVDGSGIDPILLLGDKIFGAWGLKFAMYIPSGKIGYLNVQGQETPGIQWVIGNVTFGEGNSGADDEFTGRIDWSTTDTEDDAVFTFPKDQWFDVIMDFNLETGTSTSTFAMWVDGAEVVAEGTPFADKADPPVYAQALGSLNLYSSASNCEMYFDTVEYKNEYFGDPNLSVESIESKGFKSAMSNGTLTMRANENINSVAIYNMLGQQVYNANVNSMNSTVNMSNLANGTYIVKVNINGVEGSVKVIR